MAKEWDLAEYSDHESRLGKPIPPGEVIIPGRIWLDGDFLSWHLSPNIDFPPRSRTPPKQLLNDFVRLWKADTSQILKFAQNNGVLHQDRNNVEAREPIQEWWRLSRKVCALLNIGSELRLGKKQLSRDEWRYVGLYYGHRWERLAVPGGARFELELEISQAWLGDCGFSMRWNRARAAFELEVDYRGSMLNAVGLQLALTIANSDSLYICSGCSLPYARSLEKRRPKKGQANFCDECGDVVALRQADRRRKVKMTEARQLCANGVPVNQIADRLGTKMTSVRRWCRKDG